MWQDLYRFLGLDFWYPTQNLTLNDVCCGVTNRTFSTAGGITKHIFLAPLLSNLLLSPIYFFFCQQVSFSIQSRAICPQSTFFIFYATLSFKAFCSWLASACCQYPLRASPVVCTSVPFPELPKCPGGNLTWSVSESAY